MSHPHPAGQHPVAPSLDSSGKTTVPVRRNVIQRKYTVTVSVTALQGHASSSAKVIAEQVMEKENHLKDLFASGKPQPKVRWDVLSCGSRIQCWRVPPSFLGRLHLKPDTAEQFPVVWLASMPCCATLQAKVVAAMRKEIAALREQLAGMLTSDPELLLLTQKEASPPPPSHDAPSAPAPAKAPPSGSTRATGKPQVGSSADVAASGERAR
jgi:hypothetical protein